jgi:hypothetical protein
VGCGRGARCRESLVKFDSDFLDFRDEKKKCDENLVYPIIISRYIKNHSNVDISFFARELYNMYTVESCHK